MTLNLKLISNIYHLYKDFIKKLFTTMDYGNIDFNNKKVFSNGYYWVDVLQRGYVLLYKNGNSTNYKNVISTNITIYDGLNRYPKNKYIISFINIEHINFYNILHNNSVNSERMVPTQFKNIEDVKIHIEQFIEVYEKHLPFL